MWMKQKNPPKIHIVPLFRNWFSLPDEISFVLICRASSFLLSWLSYFHLFATPMSIMIFLTDDRKVKQASRHKFGNPVTPWMRAGFRLCCVAFSRPFEIIMGCNGCQTRTLQVRVSPRQLFFKVAFNNKTYQYKQCRVKSKTPPMIFNFQYRLARFFPLSYVQELGIAQQDIAKVKGAGIYTLGGMVMVCPISTKGYTHISESRRAGCFIIFCLGHNLQIIFFSPRFSWWLRSTSNHQKILLISEFLHILIWFVSSSNWNPPINKPRRSNNQIQFYFQNAFYINAPSK